MLDSMGTEVSLLTWVKLFPIRVGISRPDEGWQGSCVIL